jgi:hypothetical protein
MKLFDILICDFQACYLGYLGDLDSRNKVQLCFDTLNDLDYIYATLKYILDMEKF